MYLSYGHTAGTKKYIFTTMNIGKKKLGACLLHNIGIAVVSECLCYLGA